MNDFIKSDLYRYYGKSNWLIFLKACLRNPAFRIQTDIRLYQSNSCVKKIVGYVLYKLNRNKKYISIPLETKIGYGLYIGHNGPIIINPTTIIGNNVNLSQFTTIGSNEGHAAIIGDNVYVGPNVCIVENVKIGDNATIGAGSVVTKDIPDNATAAGNYAKVLNYREPGRYIGNKWIKKGKKE